MQAPDKDFYRHLPARQAFSETLDTRQHAVLPDDWWLVIADIAGSTAAIADGAYKDVNTVGVACITALLNLDRDCAIPFVFGGDGATFAIPPGLVDAAPIALRGVQAMARRSFGLQLRGGMIRAGDLAADDFRLGICKYQLSPQVTQAAFSGRGWEEAERRIKSGNGHALLINEGDGPAEADFAGFECRWQAVPQFNGHKLALIVAATTPNAADNLAVYRRVSERLQQIYGDVSEYHPLRPERLKLSLNAQELQNEMAVRQNQRQLFGGLRRLLRIYLENLAGRWLFAKQRDTSEVRWSQYRGELVENTDFRKFDGVLRMIIDGSDEQAVQLEHFLESEYLAGRLAYGMHKSSAALITCLVRSHNGDHIHFVDGSDGGYALAARALKERLRNWREGR